MIKLNQIVAIISLTILIFSFPSCTDKKDETKLIEDKTYTEKVPEVMNEQTAVSDATAVEVNPNIPHYEKVSGISGNLSSIGSDTMNNLLTLWLEGFKKYYPITCF